MGGDQTLNLCLWKCHFPQGGNTGPPSGEPEVKVRNENARMKE